MKINSETTIDLTPDEIKELIVDKLLQKGYEVIEIKFNINNHKWTEGIGYNEYDYEELQFLGATIKVKSK